MFPGFHLSIHPNYFFELRPGDWHTVYNIPHSSFELQPAFRIGKNEKPKSRFCLTFRQVTAGMQPAVSLTFTKPDETKWK